MWFNLVKGPLPFGFHKHGLDVLDAICLTVSLEGTNKQINKQLYFKALTFINPQTWGLTHSPELQSFLHQREGRKKHQEAVRNHPTDVGWGGKQRQKHEAEVQFETSDKNKRT